MTHADRLGRDFRRLMRPLAKSAAASLVHPFGAIYRELRLHEAMRHRKLWHAVHSCSRLRRASHFLTEGQGSVGVETLRCRMITHQSVLLLSIGLHETLIVGRADDEHVRPWRVLREPRRLVRLRVQTVTAVLADVRRGHETVPLTVRSPRLHIGLHMLVLTDYLLWRSWKFLEIRQIQVNLLFIQIWVQLGYPLYWWARHDGAERSTTSLVCLGCSLSRA